MNSDRAQPIYAELGQTLVFSFHENEIIYWHNCESEVWKGYVAHFLKAFPPLH